MKKMMLIALCLAPVLSHASITGFSTPVTGWRLQNYVGGSVVIWYTAAQGICGGTSPAGNVSMSPSASTEERNRIWSVVETARATNRNVIIEYDTSSCQITSFGLDN